MPGAPASMHARTASITDGMRPPREFRTVATLFTFTDNLITELNSTLTATVPGVPEGSRGSKGRVRRGSNPHIVSTPRPLLILQMIQFRRSRTRVAVSIFMQSMVSDFAKVDDGSIKVRTHPNQTFGTLGTLEPLGTLGSRQDSRAPRRLF